jgi:hypothetical protein
MLCFSNSPLEEQAPIKRAALHFLFALAGKNGGRTTSQRDYEQNSNRRFNGRPFGWPDAQRQFAARERPKRRVFRHGLQNRKTRARCATTCSARAPRQKTRSPQARIARTVARTPAQPPTVAPRSLDFAAREPSNRAPLRRRRATSMLAHARRTTPILSARHRNVLSPTQDETVKSCWLLAVGF